MKNIYSLLLLTSTFALHSMQEAFPPQASPVITQSPQARALIIRNSLEQRDTMVTCILCVGGASLSGSGICACVGAPTTGSAGCICLSLYGPCAIIAGSVAMGYAITRRR